MKYIYIIIVSFIASIGISTAQNSEADSIVGDLLNRNELLTLSKNYPTLKDELHPFLQSMAASVLANSFNKPDTACLEIENLINKYQNFMDSSTLISMLYIWANNMQYLGMYKESVDLLRTFLQSIPTNNRNDIQPIFNTLLKTGDVLKEFPQPQINYNKKENCVSSISFIPISTYGTLISIPAIVNGTKEDFILDTGAEGNAISEDFAKQHKIRIIADSIETIGAERLYSKLGIIDSIEIGNIIYKHIPVHILPSSPDDKIFKVNAILGLPFLKAIKEVRIYPNDKILVIPYEPTLKKTNADPNIVLYNNQLCINTMIKDENFLFNFDTGSVISYLNSNFYNKNKDIVKFSGKKKTKLVGGFGRIDSIEVYQVPLQYIKIGNAIFKDLNLEVRMNNFMSDQRAETIGTLGVDILLQCNEIIINTDKMVVNLFNNNKYEISNCPTCIYKTPSLYSLTNSKITENTIPPSSSLPLKQPVLFYRINKKWGNIQKVDYTFDLNTMKWQSYNSSTLIRLDK